MKEIVMSIPLALYRADHNGSFDLYRTRLMRRILIKNTHGHDNSRWTKQIDVCDDNLDVNVNNNSIEEDSNGIESEDKKTGLKNTTVDSKTSFDGGALGCKNQWGNFSAKLLNISGPASSQRNGYRTQATSSYLPSIKEHSLQVDVDRSSKKTKAAKNLDITCCCNIGVDSKSVSKCGINHYKMETKYDINPSSGERKYNTNIFDKRDKTNNYSTHFKNRLDLLHPLDCGTKSESCTSSLQSADNTLLHKPVLNTNKNVLSIKDEVASSVKPTHSKLTVALVLKRHSGAGSSSHSKLLHKPDLSQKAAQTYKKYHDVNAYECNTSYQKVFGFEKLPNIFNNMKTYGKTLTRKPHLSSLPRVTSYNTFMLLDSPSKSQELDIDLKRPYVSEQDVRIQLSRPRNLAKIKSNTVKEDSSAAISTENVATANNSLKVIITSGPTDLTAALENETEYCKDANLISLLPYESMSREHEQITAHRDWLAEQRRLTFTRSTSHICGAAIERSQYVQDSHNAFSRARIPTLRRSPAYVCLPKCLRAAKSTNSWSKLSAQSVSSIDKEESEKLGKLASAPALTKSEKSFMELTPPGISRHERLSLEELPASEWSSSSRDTHRGDGCSVRIDQQNIGSQRFYHWAPYNPAKVRRVQQYVLERSNAPALYHVSPIPPSRRFANCTYAKP